MLGCVSMGEMIGVHHLLMMRVVGKFKKTGSATFFALVYCTALFGGNSWNLVFDAAIFPYWDFVVVFSCIFGNFCSCPL